MKLRKIGGWWVCNLTSDNVHVSGYGKTVPEAMTEAYESLRAFGVANA